MVDISELGGWVVAVVLGLIGTVKFFWEYLKTKNNNETKVRLNEDSRYQNSRDELKKQNEVLLNKLDEVETKLEHTEKKLNELLLAFEIVFPAIQKLVDDNPTYKPLLENAFKHFKKQE